MDDADFHVLFPDEEEQFYALTLLGENDKIVWATQTRWVGFTDESPRRELRKPRRVFARIAKIWNRIGQPFVVVRSSEEMLKFMLMGGNALISPELFEGTFIEFLEPEISIPRGYLGYDDVSFFDNVAFRRNPTPKLRMKVLNRDRRRCRVCGRNPDDHIDLELHVHHIRPWADGGVTDDKNLITLCNTCHRGLDPHFDPSLFQYTAPEQMKPDTKKRAQEHAEGVIRYREIVMASEITEDT